MKSGGFSFPRIHVENIVRVRVCAARGIVWYSLIELSDSFCATCTNANTNINQRGGIVISVLIEL